MVFLSVTSVLFVMELGVSKAAFPFFQCSILGAWLIASLTCNSAIKKWGLLKTKLAGVAFVGIGGIGFVVAAFIDTQNPYLLTAQMLVFTAGVNWIIGLYFPEGMEVLPEIKGITASLLTSARLFLAAVIVGGTSYFYDKTVLPLVIAIGGITVLVLATLFFYEKKARTSNDSLKAYDPTFIH